jgi:recombinational DNA repair ATPase RecF
MRNILHAKFGDQLAKQSRTSDKVPRTSPGPQLPSKPVEELEGALTKARDASRASRGRTRTVICNLRIARRP